MTMAVANTQTATTLKHLVPMVTETTGGATNPAAVYLSGLARTGRRASNTMDLRQPDFRVVEEKRPMHSKLWS